MDDELANIIFLALGIVDLFPFLNCENKSVCTFERMINEPHATPIQVKT